MFATVSHASVARSSSCVHVLELDDPDGVVRLEEVREGVPEHLVREVLEPVDLDHACVDILAVRELPEAPDRALELDYRELDRSSHLPHHVVRLLDAVDTHHLDGALDAVQDIVEDRGEAGDLLGLEGRDEGPVQVVVDPVGHRIALRAPGILHLRTAADGIRPGLGELHEQVGGLDQDVGHLFKQVEEDLVLRNQHLSQAHGGSHGIPG